MTLALPRKLVPDPATVVRVILLVAPVVFGVVAVRLGQGNGWDLHNYHLYDGWAFWTGGRGQDLAVAQLQSYFNPLLATFSWLLFENTPPRVSAFLLGLLQGMNVILLYLIAARVLRGADGNARPWLALATAVVGATGATQLAELGTSVGDNLVSLPTLGSFLLVLWNPAPTPRRAAGAGLLAGVATGLKLTVTPFAVGFLVAAAVLAWRQRNRWRVLLASTAALGAAFLIVDGFWLLRLYQDFGNPLFPMFAGLFGGPYVPSISLRDVQHLPLSLKEWLVFPLVWVMKPLHVAEVNFFDLRIAIAFLLAPLVLLRVLGRASAPERALVAGLAVSYLIWLPLFAIYRYLAPLEMLAPLVIAVATASLPRPASAIALAALLVIVTAATTAPDWGRIPFHGHRFLRITLPPVYDIERATVVLAEDEPLGFLALGFPAPTKFVRICGNLMGPPFPGYGLDREAARRIAATDGPLYALLVDPKSARAHDAFARQHLELSPECAPVRSNLLVGDYHASLCRLTIHRQSTDEPRSDND